MPSRPLRVLIVAFWLAVNGRLVYHDLLPYLRPDQPPPFSLDLLDEVQNRPNTLWIVTENGRRVFQARSHIDHPSAEEFELRAEFASVPGQPPPTVSGFALRRMSSRYRVNPDGQLRGLSVAVEGGFEGGPAALLLPGGLSLSIDGAVESGKFRPRAEVRLPGVPLKPVDLPEVSVPQGAGVLLPLHPLQRMRDLRPNQTWRMPVFDPLVESFQAMLPGGAGPRVRYLNARVRPEPALLEHPHRPPASCLVVDYAGDDEQTVTLWVEERTGQVLRQEATVAGGHWVMDRD